MGRAQNSSDRPLAAEGDRNSQPSCAQVQPNAELGLALFAQRLVELNESGLENVKHSPAARQNDRGQHDNNTPIHGKPSPKSRRL